MAGEQDDAMAASERRLQMFTTNDAMRRQRGSFRPPAGANFKKSQGEGIIVRPGQRGNLRGRGRRITEAQIGKNDATANTDKVKRKPA